MVIMLNLAKLFLNTIFVLNQSYLSQVNLLEWYILSFTSYCRLLNIFANSLDPDQARHVGPESESKLFDTPEKLILQKKNDDQKLEKLHRRQSVNIQYF